MKQDVDLRWARTQLIRNVDRLIEQHYKDVPFERYLRHLLRVPGGLLSEEAGSGLGWSIVLISRVLQPQKDWQDVVPAVVAVELVHSAWETLDKVLDDERFEGMDQWDASQVANAAMAIHALAVYPALELRAKGFPETRVERCLRGISTMCVRVAACNHLDIVAEGITDPTLELALELTIGKSAPIDQVIGPVAAGLATDDERTIELFTEFGSAVGIYQALANDLNDVLPGSTLKADVRKRKKTIPIVYLMTQTPQDVFGEEKRILRGSHAMAPSEEEQVRQALVKSGAIDYTSVLADSYRNKAASVLEALDPTPYLSDLKRVMGVASDG